MTDVCLFLTRCIPFAGEDDPKNHQELLSTDYIILMEITERKLKEILDNLANRS